MIKKNIIILSLGISVWTIFGQDINLFDNNNNQNNNQNTNKVANSSNLKRVDGFDNVDSNLLNQENDNFINNKIKDFPDKYNNVSNTYRWDNIHHKMIGSKDISPVHPKDLLKDIYKDKLYLKENERYSRFQQKNCNGNVSLRPHNLNYDGTWTPWWTFGVYFYWYLSLSTINWIMHYFSGSNIKRTYDISEYLVDFLGVAEKIAELISVWLFAFSYSFWIMVYLNPNLNLNKGVVIKTSWLLPLIYGVWDQSVSVSPVNSFEVDYTFCAPDYITLCLDENNLNTLLSIIWNATLPDVKSSVISFFRSLKQIDHTGAGGSITNQDYLDMYNAIISNDFNSNLSLYSFSNVIHYLKTTAKNNWKSVVIQTRRGSSYWNVWKNT